MTPFERELRRQRRRLLSVERRSAADMLATYRRIHTRLQREMAALTDLIAAREAAGEPVSVTWLYRQQRYQDLIAQVEASTLGFAQRATEIIRQGQSDSLLYAPKDAQALAIGAMGAAPAHAVETIRTRWNALGDDPFRRFAGRAADGTPLGDLLAALAPQAVQKTRDTLAYGIAAGRPVRLIAQDFAKASGATLTRSMVIARTETMGAYRAATQESYQANDHVVRTWTWQATVDRRTCASCWAQNGSEHSLDESLDSHPGCRCAMVPKTVSWAELGFDIPDRRPRIVPGEELFARQPAELQQAVLGPSKYEAYSKGRIALSDLVEHTHHPRWGAGTREASLRTALEQARQRELVTA